MVLRRITSMLDGRLYEWTFAFATLGLAFEIFVWPDTIRASAFHLLDEVMGTTTVGIITFWCGVARMVALAFNGRSWVIGPYVRAACACISATVWAQFAYALIILTDQHAGIPSPGIPFWIAFTGAEIYVGYRAMIDVRRIS